VKILVTGGAGFIGSHIVDAYLANGHEVVVIDDLSTGKSANVNSGARFVKADVRDATLGNLFAAERFDVVNHQAARGNVRASLEDPSVYADVNIRGGINLLEASRTNGVRKFIYASTGGCVYGELQYVPADERHPIVPRDPYGASKASFELYLGVYAVIYGLTYCTFRYPNVYGPRQDPFGEAGVVSIFTGQMLRGVQPVINGSGQQERDYVYVDDVARANVLALTGGDNQAFNLGSGVGVSVNTIFSELKGMIDAHVPEVHGPAKLGEVERSCLDATKADRELGWRPEVDLKAGLAKTVEYFRPLVQPKVTSRT